MKSLSDRQNQRQPIPSLEHGNMTGEQEFRNENSETKGGEENREEESDNVSDHKKKKWQKIELQGKFRKIKPPLFVGEMGELVEA